MQEKISTYDWLVGVIDSCFHDFHLQCVDRLIELFFEKYKDDALADNLKLMRKQRWEAIHGILI